MVATILTIVLSFLAITLFGHVIHWSLHQPWTGFVHQAHMTHHTVLYPPSDFSSEVYRDAGKDSSFRFFAVASLPLIITPIALTFLGLISWHLLAIIMAVEAAMGFLHDYLHDAFHIKNHWMTRIPVFKDIFAWWVRLHYIHHVDMSKNFGIFTFFWDRLFGSYQSK